MPEKKCTVAEVYGAINTERNYQDSLHQNFSSGMPPTEGMEGWRSIDEFGAYIARYGLNLLEIVGSSTDDQKKLECVRKIAALAVNCMEWHGAPLRKVPAT